MLLINYLALKIPGTDGSPVEIQTPGTVPTGGLESGGDGAAVLKNGITIFLTLVAVASVIFLILGGIKWIMAAGDKSKLDSARKTITYAIIGLVISFLAFFIINTIGGLFGVKFF